MYLVGNSVQMKNCSLNNYKSHLYMKDLTNRAKEAKIQLIKQNAKWLINKAL